MSKESDIEQVKHNTKVILNMNKKELDWVCDFLNKIENTQNAFLRKARIILRSLK